MALSEIFMESYRSCCNDCNTRLKVKSLGQDKCLEFNADRLEEQDWQPLLKALHYDRCLHTLAIKSEYVSPQRREFHQRRGTTLLARPVFQKATIMNKLTESIVACMKRSNILSKLHLQAIPFTPRHVEQLAEGIRECQSLQYLVLSWFDLEDQGLDLLYDSLYLHVGLNIVDFSSCGLTDRGAETIAKIIRTQRLARYGETWKQSLRYRKPDAELVPGVRRITLNDNPAIGDTGFTAIIHELMDDLWVKALDVQNCGLTDISGKESLDLVTLNDSIWVLDLSRNDKISPAKKKEVKLILASRKKPTDKPGDTDRYEWLEGASEMTRSQTSLKPNSEMSLRADDSSDRKKLLPVSQSQMQQFTLDLHHTKRDLDDTRRLMVKERLRREQLELERQQQKAMLALRFTKEWKKRKQVEKERDKLKMELHMLISSEGHIPKRLIKPKRRKAKPIQEASISARTTYSAEENSQTRLIRKSGKPMRTKATPTQKAAILAAKIYSTRKDNQLTRLIKTSSGDFKSSKAKGKKANSKQAAQILASTIYSTEEEAAKVPLEEKVSSLGNEVSSCYDSYECDLSETDEIALEPISSNAKPRDSRVAKRDPRTLSPMSRSQWIFSEIMSNKSKDTSKMSTSVNNAQAQTFYTTESNVD